MLTARVVRKLFPVCKMGCREYCKPMFHPLDFVTGLEKKELLAAVAGDCDPFRIAAIKRGEGTRERPVLIPSAYPLRYVGCSCPGITFQIKWMSLHLGEIKRCGCGYHFELCPVAPFC